MCWSIDRFRQDPGTNARPSPSFAQQVEGVKVETGQPSPLKLWVLWRQIKKQGVHQKLWWSRFQLYPGASRFLPCRHVLASAWWSKLIDITSMTTSQERQGYFWKMLYKLSTEVWLTVSLDQKLNGFQSTMISHQNCFATIYPLPTAKGHCASFPSLLWGRESLEKSCRSISWIKTHQHFRGQDAISRCFYIMNNSWGLLFWPLHIHRTCLQIWQLPLPRQIVVGPIHVLLRILANFILLDHFCHFWLNFLLLLVSSIFFRAQPFHFWFTTGLLAAYFMATSSDTSGSATAGRPAKPILSISSGDSWHGEYENTAVMWWVDGMDPSRK